MTGQTRFSLTQTMSRLLACALVAVALPLAAQDAAIHPKLAGLSTNPNAQKISLNLLKLKAAPESRGPVAQGVVVAKDTAMAKTKDGTVLAEIVCSKLDDDILRKFALPGIEVIKYYPEFKRVTIAVKDPADLETLADIPEVAMIREVIKPVAHHQGTVDSRADQALQTAGLVEVGVTGAGQKIGVISDSFAWTASVRDSDTVPPAGFAGTLRNAKNQDSDSGDLPAQVQIVDDTLGSYMVATDEGAAMAELIHDVAPGAEIAFATCGATEASFADAVQRLREAGCTIIVDDISYRDSPMYQDGIATTKVAEVVAAGVAFFSAAGNDYNTGLKTNYVDINPYRSELTYPVQGKDLHNWGNKNTFLPVNLPAERDVTIVLQWNQPFQSLNTRGGSQIDLDLYVLPSPLLSAFATPIAEGRTAQGFPRYPLGDALEVVTIPGGAQRTVYLAVDLAQGRRTIPQNSRVPLEFRLVFWASPGVQVQGIDDFASQFAGPTIYGHRTAAGAVCVAAVPWWEALKPELGPTTLIDPEAFSSLGGTLKTIFNQSGSLLRTARTYSVPTLAAVDACNTTFFGSEDAALPDYVKSAGLGEPDGFKNFFGTSAAAPNAAAVAALVKQQHPTYTPAQLTQRLIDTARDVTGYRCAVGWDNVTGYGLIDGQSAGSGGGTEEGINLTFNKLSGWSDSLVVNQTASSTINSVKFAAGKDVLVHFNITNNGQNAAGPFNVAVLVDGGVVQNIAVPGLAVGAQFAQQNINIGSFAPNTNHTVTVRIDSASQVTESNETDNEKSFSFDAELPKANDDFVNNLPLEVCSPQIVSDNYFCTKEAGEPAHAGNVGGSSIWYRWTAPGSGRVTINTIGSDFDTLLAVYRGLSVNALTLVAANNDIAIGTNKQSSVTFDAVAGVMYMIAVDGVNGAQGNVVLNAVTRPANDDFANRADLPGPSGNIRVTNICAEPEVGEPAHAGSAPSHSLWYKWTAQMTGVAQFSTAGSSFDTVLSVYVGTTLGDLSLVGSPGDDLGLSENDNFLPDGASVTYSTVIFRVQKGQTYVIAADGKAGAAGNLALNYSSGIDNDFYGAPTVIPDDCWGSLLSTNIDGTTEPNEPRHAGNLGGKTAWFRWTAPPNPDVTKAPTDSYSMTFDTVPTRADLLSNPVPSSFNTMVGVYIGSSAKTSSLIAFNDDADQTANPSMLTSRVSFVATPGMTYFISVDGFNSGGVVAEGLIRLNWCGGFSASEDMIVRARTDPKLDQTSGTEEYTTTVLMTNRGATIEPNEPDHAFVGTGQRTVWFKFIVPATTGTQEVRLFTLTTEATTTLVGCQTAPVDTVLAVYTGGPAMTNLAPVAYNDDSPYNPPNPADSQVSFFTYSGNTYYVAVDGKDGSYGNFTLTIDDSLAPPDMAPEPPGQ